MNLSNLSVLLVTTIPIWSFGLTYLKTRNKLILPGTLIISVAATIFLYFNFIPFLKISRYAYFYTGFLSLYIIMLDHRGIRNPLRNLGFSLMLIFIAADLWEIPVFTLGALGIQFTEYYNLAYQIHHLYILAVFYLFKKNIAFKFTKKFWFLMGLNIILVSLSVWLYQVKLARVLNLIIFGLSINEGLKNGSMVGS